MLPRDLKDYHEDSFSLFHPDDAIGIIAIIGIIVIVFKDFIR